MKRNPYLTAGMERVLQMMRTQDEELVYEPGGGWWIDLYRTNGKVALALIRLCLIHKEDYESGPIEHYGLNPEGRKILDDPDYVPQILNTTEGRSAIVLFAAGRKR